jgi:hypothetical protein
MSMEAAAAALTVWIIQAEEAGAHVKEPSLHSFNCIGAMCKCILLQYVGFVASLITLQP